MTGNRNIQSTEVMLFCVQHKCRKLKKQEAKYQPLVHFLGNSDSPFTQKTQRKLWCGLVKICDVKGCTKDTQLQMPATNEQIIIMLLPMYSHTFCRSDTHLSTRDKYRNRDSPANITKFLQNYFSEHSAITSLEENPNSCRPGLSHEQIKAVPGQAAWYRVHRIPDPIHCYTRRLEYQFTQTGPVEHGTRGKDPHFFSLGAGERQGRCQEHWYSST